MTDPPTQAFGTRTSGLRAPPPAEPERRRRRLLPWLSVVVILLAGVAAGAVLLLGGDDDPGPGGSSSTTATGDDTSAPPEGAPTADETVEAYFAALADHDCETLISYVSEASWSEGGTLSREEALRTCEEDQAGAPEYSLESVDITEGGGEQDDTAVADVVVAADGESTTTPVHLVREDGVWKIDFTQV